MPLSRRAVSGFHCGLPSWSRAWLYAQARWRAIIPFSVGNVRGRCAGASICLYGIPAAPGSCMLVCAPVLVGASTHACFLQHVDAGGAHQFLLSAYHRSICTRARRVVVVVFACRGELVSRFPLLFVRTAKQVVHRSSRFTGSVTFAVW